MMQAIIAESEDAPRFYGAAGAFMEYTGPEAMLTGPYETGKTFAALYKFHLLMCLFPRSRGLMVRKTYKSLKQSAIITFEKKVLPVPPDHSRSQVRKHGGENVEFYSYPNGSRLIVGGMDVSDKVLSAEYDFIYANQAEELDLDDWEKLAGRATGRAGNAPYTQMLGDCNPGPPHHWILKRDRLRRFQSRHEDNPTLYDHRRGDWTAQGRKSLATLDSLTGVRYKRGRLGLWVGVEGQVYEDWNQDIHLIEPFPIPQSWRRFRIIDFGYTNPFVCLWAAVDNDGRVYIYRQLYMSQRTVARHMIDIHVHSRGETYEVTLADHDAEDRATLAQTQVITDGALVERLKRAGYQPNRAGHVEMPGIQTKAADKRVGVGIEKVQQRLKTAGDGKPRLYLFKDCLIEEDPNMAARFRPTSLVEEFPSYAWQPATEDRNTKEEPVKANDHALDALRYGVLYLDGDELDKPASAPGQVFSRSNIERLFS